MDGYSQMIHPFKLKNQTLFAGHNIIQFKTIHHLLNFCIQL